MSALTSATPMQVSSKPKQPPISPLIRLPSERAAIRVRPNMASQKYSTGPKARATLASGGARASRKAAPTNPPVTEARQARVTARSPSPRLAMGKPSKVVAMAEGVPGVFSRMAE